MKRPDHLSLFFFIVVLLISATMLSLYVNCSPFGDPVTRPLSFLGDAEGNTAKNHLGAFVPVT